MRNAARAVVVAIVAALAGSSAAADTPLAIHIHSERAMFQVLISPGTVGTDSFVLQLMSGEGTLLPVKQATLVLTLPERGIEPLARRAVLGADRYWRAPCKGGAFQWVKVPPGNRSSRKQSEQSWR
jgi:copper transport protein